MSIKICCICESEGAKYKCPKCRQLYCSSVCCNKHKENCKGRTEITSSEVNQDLAKKNDNQYDFPTEDTVPIEKLEQLRYNQDVKNYLKNPQIRDIISCVLKEADPTKAVAKAMTENIFADFADACLKIVEPPDEDKPC